ncbi:unnamed protein product [Ectocarpus sp. CCAP 1310/34]|nr:unnamed protein product [Ectocarpus sp. CCAP 1310/34]
MSAEARSTAWTDAVRVASGAAADADRAAAQQAQAGLTDEEFRQEVSARQEELKVLRAKRDTNSKAIFDLDTLQRQCDRQRSQLAATLTADRRQEDALVEAGRKAGKRRRTFGEVQSGRLASREQAGELRANRLPLPPRPARHITFESGDFRFTPAKLADVAQYHQFNFLPLDSTSVRDLATEVAIALPAAVTIHEAVDVANTSRPDIRDLAGRFLAGMRKANAHATAPVVYPG